MKNPEPNPNGLQLDELILSLKITIIKLKFVYYKNLQFIVLYFN